MSDATNEFLHIRGGPGRYDLMTWPNPDDPAGVEWRLRYHRYATDAERRREQVVAASYMNAYRALVELPQRERNQRISQIRTAAEAARRNAVNERAQLPRACPDCRQLTGHTPTCPTRITDTLDALGGDD